MIRFSCTSPDCSACGEECPINECPKSEVSCGHHCNHSWSHDSCCWCKQEWPGLELVNGEWVDYTEE